MISEYGVNVLTLVVLKTLLHVLQDEFLLFEGGFPRRDGWRSNGVGWPDEGDWADERVFRLRQDDPKVDILAPSSGNLNQCRVIGEEMMSVLDGWIVRFTRLLGEGWGWEATTDGAAR